MGETANVAKALGMNKGSAGPCAVEQKPAFGALSTGATGSCDRFGEVDPDRGVRAQWLHPDG